VGLRIYLRRCAALWLVCFACGATARAQEFAPFVIEDIRVEGLQRVNPGSVFRYLPLSIGDNLGEGAAIEAVRALYATGYFRDIALEQDGNILVVRVSENPTVAEVTFTGMEEFPEDELREDLRRLGLGKALIFSRAALERAAALIEASYIQSAFYQAEIESTVSPLPRNRVAVNFAISEGAGAAIREIRIIGAEAFDEDELLDLFELETTGFLSFLDDSDKYAQERLAADLERLRSHYLENGYLRFAVRSHQVELTPDKRGVHIIVNVEEGGVYAVAGHQFEGESPLSDDALRGLAAPEVGATYRESEAGGALRGIRDALGDLSFAFADVRLDPRIDDESGEVTLTYQIVTGPPVYVRRIEVVGNYATRDEVIRRELLQFEREPYSRAKIERSMGRLRRLGFFDSVSHREERVANSPDEVDITIEVAEGKTGSISGGVGYSDSGGVILRGAFKQRNIFGTGNEFAFSVERSEDVRRFDVSFEEAYHTDDGVSRRISLSRAERESDDDVSSYSLDTEAVELGYGVPLSLDDILNFSLAYERVNIDNSDALAEENRPFTDEHGDSPDAIVARAGVVRDTRNTAFNPSAGSRQSLSSEAALPGLDLKYYRLSYTHDWYRALGGEWVFHFGGEASYGDDYGGAVYPFYKRFYLGGANSLRGFTSGSIGPVDDDDDAVGGQVRLLANNEISAPLPLWTKDKNFFVALFIDAGAIYADPGDIDPGEIRASAGAEFRWITPIGPLKLVFAKPLNKEDTDDTQTFQFTLGTF
jgi:outer membrane protein insertion porin family